MSATCIRPTPLCAPPLGTKAFYESLDRLPDFFPVAHFQPFTKITTLHDTTYLYLAEPSGDHDPTEREAAEQLERLVTAMAASCSRSSLTSPTQSHSCA